MPLQLSGKLITPLGSPAANALIKFKAVSSADNAGGEVIYGSSQVARCAADGTYSLSLEFCRYEISTRISTQDYVVHGEVTVDQNTSASDLEDLIALIGVAPVLTDELIAQFVKLKGEAESAASSASLSASSASTDAATASAAASAATSAASQASADAQKVASDKASVDASQQDVTTKAQQVSTDAAQVASNTPIAVQAATDAKSWAVGPSGSGTGTDTNNAKYWAQQAEEKANQIFVNGGPFTPSAGSEYPDVTGVTKDTAYPVNLTHDSSYTFVSGQLAGKTALPGDMMLYDIPSNTWSLIESGTSGALTEASADTLYRRLDAQVPAADVSYGPGTVEGELDSTQKEFDRISDLESSSLSPGQIASVKWVDSVGKVSGGRFEIITSAEATSRGLTLGYTITNGIFYGEAFSIANGNVAVTSSDEFGFRQALLSAAGIVPTGTPESATASQYLDAIKLILQPVITGSGRTVEARLDDVRSASDFGIVPGGDVTTELNALAAQASGKRIYFGPGVYTMNGVLWTSISDFELHFHPDCVFKLADGANTFAFRLSVCSNFNIRGKIKGDGNKANNTPGGSSPGAANATIGFSGCLNFTVDDMECTDGWTNGLTMDGCSRFVINSMEANDTARRGVTLTGCSDFYVARIRGANATQNNVFYIINCQRWAIDSVITAGAGGSNGALFEADNQFFYVGSVVDTGSYSGIKFQECYDFTVGYAFAKDTTVSHCFTLNKTRRYSIGSVIVNNSIQDGVAFLAAGAAHTDGHVGSIISTDNQFYGVQCQQNAGGFFSKIRIDSLITNNNTLSNFEMDGGIINTAFSIGYFRGGNAGSGFDIEDNTPTDPTFDRAGFDNIGSSTSNYSNVPELSPNAAAPNIGQFLNITDIVETANTVATTVTRLTGYTGPARTFYIAINDNNTTFANGTGEGRIIVQGASVAAAFGELWQVTYRNDIMYLHKVS